MSSLSVALMRVQRYWTGSFLVVALCFGCGRARYLASDGFGEADGTDTATGGTGSGLLASGGAFPDDDPGSGGSSASSGAGGQVRSCVDEEIGGATSVEDCLDQDLAPVVKDALAGTRDAEGHVHPEWITELNFYNGGIEGVECLPNLRQLKLSRGTEPSVSEQEQERLSRLRNLVSLEVMGASDIDFLICMPRLESLTLYGNMELSGLTPLRKLTNLQELFLSGVFGVDSLQVLGELPQLKRLKILDVQIQPLGARADASFLASLRLEELYVFVSLDVVDLARLDTSRLTALDLGFVNVANLDSLGPPAEIPGHLQLSQYYQNYREQLCESGWCPRFADLLGSDGDDSADCSKCGRN